MINFETIEFIGTLNELARKSENGIKPFSEATCDNFHDYVFYDETEKTGNGGCKIVCDACLVCDHHDVVSYLGAHQFEFKACVLIDDEGNPYIQIDFPEMNGCIVVENGNWYTV